MRGTLTRRTAVRPLLTAMLALAASNAVPQEPARPAPSVIYPTTAELREAMQKLDWMIGRWEGMAWSESAPTGRQEFAYSVTVRPDLDGLLLVIDMIGHVAANRPLVFARQVLVSGPPPAVLPGPTGTYSWQEPARLGPYLMGNEAQGTARSLQVGLPLGRADCDWIVDEPSRHVCLNGGEGAWSRTSISLNDQGEWVETREWQSTGMENRSWHTYFRAVLRRVEPVQQAAPP